MLPNFVITNEIWVYPPNEGTWVVYSINVGSKKYIGQSSCFKQRMLTHARCIKDLIYKSNIPYFIARGYEKFCPACIRQYGVRFEIESYCFDAKEATDTENRLIVEATIAGVELNQWVPKYIKPQAD